MTEYVKIEPSEIAEFRRRKLRAETEQVERDVVLNERRHLLEWLRSIALIGAAFAAIFKVFGGA